MLFISSNKKLEIELSKRAADICDQVVSEMGAELHDDLIQKLSIFRLYIDQIERSSTNPQEVESLVIKMRRDFDLVIRTVKSISRNLLPANIEADVLTDMLAILCQNMERPGASNIHFSHNGILKSLDKHAKQYLLRIVQELIQNALKHSSAWHIWVRLKSNDNTLIIEVEDDGTGAAKIPFFIERLRKKNNTLKMRTQAIGASIEYHQGEKGLLAIVKLKY